MVEQIVNRDFLGTLAGIVGQYTVGKYDVLLRNVGFTRLTGEARPSRRETLRHVALTLFFGREGGELAECRRTMPVAFVLEVKYRWAIEGGSCEPVSCRDRRGSRRGVDRRHCQLPLLYRCREART